MKGKLITLLVALSFIGSSFAQEETPKFGHWSMAIKGGLNYFRLEPNAGKPGWSMFETRVNNASWSAPIIGIEYTVNPYYGFGIEGGWYNYNREGLKGGTVDLMFNNSANLSNLLAPNRQNFWKKSTFYVNAAIGVGFFKNEPLGGRTVPEKDGITPVTMAGLEYNYNFTSHLALILEGQYRVYWVDGMGTAPRTTGSDDALMANIGLRIKFHGKDKTHVRDANVVEYYGEKTAAIQSQSFDPSELIAQNRELASKIAKNEADIKQLQNDLKGVRDTLNEHLKQPRTQAPVKYTPTQEEKKVIETAFANLEFQTGSAVIESVSYGPLDGLANLLKRNPNWTVTLNGHTDNVGSAEMNLELSKNRVEAVKAYLVNRGVPASVITTNGFGMERPITSNDTAAGRAQNRRVEIELFLR